MEFSRIFVEVENPYRQNERRTLESVIDVGQGINVGPRKFVKKNKRRALNKTRKCTKGAKLW